MKAGYVISFDLERWDEKGHSYVQEVSSIVRYICDDPLGNHESKCSVKVDGEEYGIPFSEIKNVIPAGDQLNLFSS
tara:strand:+ start:3768 stop:3995 length:228 start_codon:yes stop_codon:yes gene_type:complete